MNFRTISVIIAREYKTRVQKKSFLVITFLGPILFAALCLLPSLIMVFAKDSEQKVAVLDESGFVSAYLENNDQVTYYPFENVGEEQLQAKVLQGDVDSYLMIGAPDSTLNVPVKMASTKSISMDLKEAVTRQIEDAVEDARMSHTGIENLREIMASIKPDVDIKTAKFNESGDEAKTSTEITMIISMVLAMIIYMFISMFSGMVMNSVIEEKSSRVVEVLISSVKSTELMFGKIIGVAGVALTQFLLWIVLTAVLLGIGGSIMGVEKISQSASEVAAAETMGMTESMAPAFTTGNADIDEILVAVQSINFTEILITFFVFFILGYLLYASLFAAIGSAADNEADTQQLQIPVTIPLLLAFFIGIYAFKAPESQVVFWGSMIPFTSPIVMLARIPNGDVAVWELAVSIGLLLVTFVALAWASAKIYKVGILMYGKKNSFKDLWRWLRQ